MEFSFETQGAGTYLVYRLGEDGALDSPGFGMLTNNRIRGVAPVLFTQRDGNKYLKYNVSAKVPLGKLLTGTVTKKRLLGALASIAEAILEAEEYMLDASMFALERDYIFADVTTCEAALICLPVIAEESRAPDMREFFKDIVFGARYDASENGDYVAKIISFLNGEGAFSLGDFAALARRLAEGVPEDGPESARRAAAQELPREAPPERERTRAAEPFPRIAPPPAPTEPPAPPAPEVPPEREYSPPPAFPAPPPRAPENAAAAERPDAPEGGGREISLLGLMMHYSKENKEAYAARRARKKAAAEAPGRAVPAKRAAACDPREGFAVPGAAAPPRPAARRESPEGRAPAAMPERAAPESGARVSASAYPPAPERAAPEGRAGNFGETVVLNSAAGGVTMSLSDGGGEDAPHLIRSRNNERIKLSKPVFRIGKERSFADYFISDNTAVSRGHAEFTSRGGEYFVSDMNSTNHTYVNDEMLAGGTAARIRHGDKIRLADEEFEFRLY